MNHLTPKSPGPGLTLGQLVALGLVALPVVAWCALVPALRAETRAVADEVERERVALLARQTEAGWTPRSGGEASARQIAARARWAELRARLLPKDAALDRWFEPFSALPPGHEPGSAHFTAEWLRQRRAVLGEAWTVQAAPIPGRLLEAQRRFNVEAACQAALRDAPDGLVSLEVGAREALPGVGGVIAAKLVARVAFPELTRLVRDLLASDLCMRIADLEVNHAPFERHGGVAVDGKGGYFPERAYVVAQPPGEGATSEPRLRVTLRLEVLDFDLDAKEAR